MARRAAVAPILLGSVVLMLSALTARGAEGAGVVYIPNEVDDPMLHEVVLPMLDGSGFLRGDRADVGNSLTDRAYSASLEFRYDPDAWGEERIHFAETMAYYHITATNSYVASLGYDVARFALPTTVYAARPFGPTWVPVPTEYEYDTKRMYFSATFDLAGSDALDADVIVHEYAHAIQHDLLGGVPGVFVAMDTTPSEQALAIMEGLADHLAASRFADPEIGERHCQLWGLGAFTRSVDNFRRWPADLVAGGSHATGMILSGAVWDLRSAVGPEVADRLALRLIQLLPDNDPGTPELNTTFADSLAAILQADSELYAAGHQEAIRQAFAVRGIGEYDFGTPFPMVRDPGNSYDGTETYALPGAGVLRVTFDEFVTRLDDSPYTTCESPRPGTDEKATVDVLAILDGADSVVGEFTGRELQGATVCVPGDTVKFHLVTDAYLAPFGYRVLDICPLCPGDGNADGAVDGADYTVWADNYHNGSFPPWSCGGWGAGNFNEDTGVDGADYTIWADRYAGSGSPLPCPSGLAVLLSGGLALIRRAAGRRAGQDQGLNEGV